MALADVCGQLIVGGFAGHALSPEYARALAEGRRGGAILFKRNLSADIFETARLTESIRDAATRTPQSAIAGAREPTPPPLIAIDQEGGRVARLGPPLLELPPMRTISDIGNIALAERAACAQAKELAALGFTINFAPVLDVNTCETNPVIGDRAFGDHPETVARFGEAWARGLDAGGILACGKHYPGHGDTIHDSHFDLPTVSAPRDRIQSVELVPFEMAARAGVASLMTAHVMYPALDAENPATLSPFICTALLRERLEFRGVLISDDLEMKAISDRYGVEDAAVRAIGAGCDALLICTSESLQDSAHLALVHRAENNVTFRSRCEEAAARVLSMRRRHAPRRLTDAEIGSIVGGTESRAIAEEIRQLTETARAENVRGSKDSARR